MKPPDISLLQGEISEIRPRVKKLIQKALDSLEKPFAMRAFIAVSFAESALVPVPVEALYLPLLTSRRSPWVVAFWGTVSSVSGGMVGYLIGYALLQSVGLWLIRTYGLTTEYHEMRAAVGRDPVHGALLILAGAVTPIPFKLVCITAGAMHYSFPLFVLVALFGRALRFYVFAVAFAWYGDSLREFMIQRPQLVTVIVIAVTAAGALVVLI